MSLHNSCRYLLHGAKLNTQNSLASSILFLYPVGRPVLPFTSHLSTFLLLKDCICQLFSMGDCLPLKEMAEIMAWGKLLYWQIGKLTIFPDFVVSRVLSCGSSSVSTQYSFPQAIF